MLHPGPIIRGLELTAGVADGPQSAILEQVATEWPFAWRWLGDGALTAAKQNGGRASALLRFAEDTFSTRQPESTGPRICC